MFNGWTPWAWVFFAWGQLVVAYAGYLLYLRWRVKRLEKLEESSSNG